MKTTLAGKRFYCSQSKIPTLKQRPLFDVKLQIRRSLRRKCHVDRLRMRPAKMIQRLPDRDPFRIFAFKQRTIQAADHSVAADKRHSETRPFLVRKAADFDRVR